MTTAAHIGRERLEEPEPDERVVRSLQRALIDVLELQMQAKHLHWNVVGRGFATLHTELDAIADAAATTADELAERSRATGGVPTGRTADVASRTTLRPVPAGELSVFDAAGHALSSITSTVRTLAEAQRIVSDLDAASADVLNAGILALEKHAWMLAAELAT